MDINNTPPNFGEQPNYNNVPPNYNNVPPNFGGQPNYNNVPPNFGGQSNYNNVPPNFGWQITIISREDQDRGYRPNGLRFLAVLRLVMP